MRIHYSFLISFAAMLKILNSARALCSQPSTSTLPHAKWPTQHRAPSRRVPAPADLHNLAGEAFHSLTSTTMTELLALAHYGVHMATAQQRLRSDCRHPPPSGRDLPSHHKVLCNTEHLQTEGLTPSDSHSSLMHQLCQLDSQESFFIVSSSHRFTFSVFVQGHKESGWRGLHVIWQYFSTTAWTLPLKAGHVFSHALRHFTTWYQNSRRGCHMLAQEGLMSKQTRRDLRGPSEAFIRSLTDGWE